MQLCFYSRSHLKAPIEVLKCLTVISTELLCSPETVEGQDTNTKQAPTTRLRSKSRKSLFFPILMLGLSISRLSSQPLHTQMRWVAMMQLADQLFMSTTERVDLIKGPVSSSLLNLDHQMKTKISFIFRIHGFKFWCSKDLLHIRF